MTSFAQTVPCFAGWGGRPGSCRLLLSLRNAPTKPIVLSSYVQASGPLDENLLEFFIVLSHKPTPSTLPSVQLPCRVFILWARFLESWNSRFLFFNTARTGGREQTLLLCDHWQEQNSESSVRVMCSHACSLDLIAGKPRSSEVGRLSS